jgi:isoleucyl-tRNA synthetase
LAALAGEAHEGIGGGQVFQVNAAQAGALAQVFGAVEGAALGGGRGVGAKGPGVGGLAGGRECGPWAAGAFAGGHYGANEFHPVVSKLQVFCSEDLGAFYLDILKDRLYTTAAGSHARRSAQTALWQITHAMLRWMAPFLSFTAEEAWGVMGGQGSLFTQTFWRFATAVLAEAAPGSERLARWARIRAVRDVVNKEIEALRSTGGLGSSLQAEVAITAGPEDHAALASLGDDLKFVLITSAACLLPGSALQVQVGSLQGRPGIAKCDRCWHWRADVGQDAAHPTLCGRCTSNLFGTGEARCCA